mmetsp:Transcript_23403/g.58401  ORF Transcript_23403/g.58401 Transcript_23403/m.58401 type:complete len:251 (+) Transcript_23403:3-755(+)
MRAHAANAAVQEEACRALFLITFGTDTQGYARRQTAVDTLPPIVAAMRAHAANTAVQQQACRALAIIAHGNDAQGNVRAGGSECGCAAPDRRACARGQRSRTGEGVLGAARHHSRQLCARAGGSGREHAAPDRRGDACACGQRSRAGAGVQGAVQHHTRRRRTGLRVSAGGSRRGGADSDRCGDSHARNQRRRAAIWSVHPSAAAAVCMTQHCLVSASTGSGHSYVLTPAHSIFPVPPSLTSRLFSTSSR